MAEPFGSFAIQNEPQSYVETAPKGEVDVQLGSMEPPDIDAPPHIFYDEPLGGFLKPMKPASKIPFGMKLLATIAAIKGSPELAMNLMNMERKGQAFNETLGHREEINRLIRLGKEQEAYKMLQDVQSRILPVAPEMAPMFQEDLKRIDQKSAARAEMLRYADELKSDIKSGVYNQTTMPIMKRAEEKLRAAAPTVRNEEEIKRTLAQVNASFSPLPSQNALAATYPSGAVAEIPMTQQFDAQSLKGMVGDELSSQTGLTVDQISNVMRGQPHYNTKGQDIAPLLKPLLTQKITELKGLEAQIELRKSIAKVPEVEAARQQDLERQGLSPKLVNFIMNAGGLTNEQMKALGVQGGAVKSSTESAREIVVRERERVAEAPVRAKATIDRQSPLQQSEFGKQYVALKGDEGDIGTFGNEDVRASFDSAQASGGKINIISRKANDEIVQPSLKIIRDLNQASKALSYFGAPDDVLSKLSVAAQRAVIRWTNSNDPNMTAGEAAAKIARRAIENFGKTMNIPDRDVGELKDLVGGLGAGVSGSQAVVDELQSELVARLKQAMNKESGLVEGDLQQRTRSDAAPVKAKSPSQSQGRTVAPTAKGAVELMGVRDATADVINERLKITGGTPDPGEYVLPGDSMERAQGRYNKAMQRLQEAQSAQKSQGAPAAQPQAAPQSQGQQPVQQQQPTPRGGTLHFDRAR